MKTYTLKSHKAETCHDSSKYGRSKRKRESETDLEPIYLVYHSTLQNNPVNCMEQKSLQDELTCAICLNIYKDPVVIPCQHSFCYECIKEYWIQKSYDCSCDCPQCRMKFETQPSLEKNFTLCNIVNQIQPSSPGPETPDIVLCDFCVDGTTAATRSCLKCETSFCSLHLQAHLTRQNLKEHTLSRPVASFSERKCSVHSKVFEFYCKEDGCCVCASCSVHGTHRNHTLLSLEEAAVTAMVLLKDEVKNLKSLMSDLRKMKLHLNKMEADVLTQAERYRSRILLTYSEIQKQTKEDEQFLLQQINLQKQEVISKIEQHCKQVDAVMQTLKEKEKDIQDNLADEPLSLIQVIHRAAEIESFPDPPDDLKLHESKFLSILRERTQQHHGYLTAIWHILNCQSLTFDLNTVHTNLTVSQDRKTVTWSESKQSYSPHPERFTYDSQVLCSECFNSGISTWDIKISGEYFKIGIAYQKLERKKLLTSILGQNSASWCICSLKGEFKAWHNNICTYFTPTKGLQHIRVCLDYEGGTLSFYQVANTLRHLHTFNTTFSEPVYPAFKCGDDTTMTLC
ncbi:TRI65 protein, partial [Polypterus senegalus]